jgi:putative membrane protein (TIGR04086 family)
MKKTSKKEAATGTKGLLQNAVKGGILGLLVTMGLLFAVSALTLAGVLPATLGDTFIILAVILGATLSGLYCAGRQGGGVVVAGLAAAAAYAVLLLLGTMLFRKSGNEPAMTLKLILAAVAGGCFGGVLKLNRKHKKSKLRR